jgi:hypothetical protein
MRKNNMKTIAKLGIALCFAGAFSYGAVWRGAKLLDASCYDQNGKAIHEGTKCAPTSSTTSFVMKTRYGKIYKLDAMSNEKVQKAIEEGVLKPNGRARITGKREGNGFVTVNSITHGTKGEY